jgi:hypothetical protein
MIPKAKPPNPNAQFTNPLMIPFLLGKWLKAAYSAVENMSPLPNPKVIPKAYMKSLGFSI